MSTDAGTPMTDEFARTHFGGLTDFARQLERELSEARAKLAAAEEKRKEVIRNIVATCEYIGRDWKDAGMCEHVYATDYLVGHIRATNPDVFKEKDNG